MWFRASVFGGEWRLVWEVVEEEEGFCSGPAFLAPGVVWVGEGLASFSWL